MPTYDYVCQDCGHALELFQSMSEAPKRKCPECGKLKLKRQIGMGAGIVFKGSGFYETDYRSDSYKQSAEAEKKASSSGDSKSEPKKDAAAQAPKKDAGDSTPKKDPAPKKSDA